MSDPIIKLDDVSFTYAGTQEPSLDSVTFDIHPGECLGIVGPSGAGKSTLAAVLSGAIPHHFAGQFYGAVYVDGKDTCEISLTDISRKIGSVAQDIDAQMVASTVEDELLFGLENFGVDHAIIEQRMSDALKTVGITTLRNREIATLSGGQKQKVAIAAILALRPQVLVLDEPTAALDPASSKLVFETLAHVRATSDIAVVVIEQKVALLSQYCDRLCVLDGGKVRFLGTPHEVFAHGRELREMGVDSPRTARVYNSLVHKGLMDPSATPALSVDECTEMIGRLVGLHGASNAAGKKSDHVPATNSTATQTTAAPHRTSARYDGTSAPVIELSGVSFSYPGTGDGVTGVDMRVYPGELVGIVGQNGAGKTTLSKLLCGLLKPTSGRCVVAGLDTTTTPVSKLATRVSTLFQNPDHQLCKNTVLDEVAFGPLLHGTPADEAYRRARKAIERFGLPEAASPFTLSRGQRQMVALASVVVNEPQVVLLDEPTAGLDYRECMTVMQTVAELADKGCAVVMVCHDMEVVSDFAERAVVMADGKVLARGRCEKLFSTEELMDAASIEAPQIVQLSKRLASEVSPHFAGLTQVGQVVDACEELCR